MIRLGGVGFWGFVLPAMLLAAPKATASVGGTVTDGASGVPLAGAVVSLGDLDRTTLTDAQGRYLFEDVPPGPQHVLVRRVGYAPQSFHALAPRQGTLEIHVALRPEPIRLRSVDVRTSVPIRGLETAGTASYPDRGLSLAAVRSHPLLSEPDVLEAAGGGEVVLRPESPSGLHVRGGASDQLTYLLDGIPVFSPYHAAGTFSAWNPDALARIELVTLSRPPAFPNALTGAVSARTRARAEQLRAQGSLSTTQARGTIDGPLGRAGAGCLASYRTTFPGLLLRKKESSHVNGDSHDWIGALDSPLWGGRLQGLTYGSESEIEAAAESGPAPPAGSGRNVLAWDSKSFGAGWTRRTREASALLRLWSAAGDADATWSVRDSLSERLTSRRRDMGLIAVVELGRADSATSGSATSVGVHAARSRTTYWFRPDSGNAFARNVRTPVAAAFLQHERITSRGGLALSLVGTLADDEVHLGPAAVARWKPTTALTLVGTYARRHQFAQSLRNPESVVGNIFPVDVYVGAGGAGVPVARTHLGIAALEYRPSQAVRVGVQAYARDFEGLALVAPRSTGSVATSGIVQGSGEARGLAVEVGANGARYGLIASYGLQRLRLRYADSTYVPDQGATHTLDGGIVLFPSATSDVRLGAVSVLGRRTTAVVGPFEWEACNLLDQGCEFAGSARQTGALGGTRLPAYVRVDLSIRKHWHRKFGGRDGQLALFGTATNLLGRKNVLTVAVDPSTGEQSRIEMRPRSPLVLGVDWRF